MSSDLDILEDLLLQPVTAAVRSVGKFRPKLKTRAENEIVITSSSIPSESDRDISASVSSGSSVNPLCSGSAANSLTGVAETLGSTTAVDAAHLERPISVSDGNLQKIENSQASMLHNSGPFQPDDGRSNKEATDLFTSLESLDEILFCGNSTTGMDFVSPSVPSQSDRLDVGSTHSREVKEMSVHEERDSQMESGREEVTKYSALESLDDVFAEPTFSSVSEKSKFIPKPRTKTISAESVHQSDPNDVMDSCSNLHDTQFHPTANEHVEEGSTPFQPDTCTNSSNIFRCEPSRTETPAYNLRTRISSSTKEIGDRAQSKGLEEIALSGEDHGHEKSSRKLRKRSANNIPIEGTDYGTDETTDNSTFAEDYMDDADYIEEEEIHDEKKAPRKTKVSIARSEKQAQVHKEAPEPSGLVNKEPLKKKFSHSTRRKRRLVNKELLETPEDEIDHTKLTIKDLILLAEIKERKINKEAAALKKASPNPSKSNPRQEDDHDNFEEDDPFGVHRAESTQFKLNYHSFMVRTPRERWSPSDTKLFYEAVRQFGSDFAMMQHLFPGRTRHQIKLKFKAEERKHPMQVADALMHRSKDNSHFELVIQRLQAQAEENPNRDSLSADRAGDNEENVVEGEDGGDGQDSGKEEVAKPEGEEYMEKDRETAAHSPQVSQDVEEEYDWSNYRSVDSYSPEDAEKLDSSFL